MNSNEAMDKRTTVEEGTTFKGTMSSTCPVMVRGTIDGEIEAPSLDVAETGTVVGNVRVESIRSSGVLAGTVDADDVYLSGSVRSDTVIRAKSLEVKLQRERGKLEVSFGDCVLEVGDDPAVEASDTSAQSKSEAKPSVSEAPAAMQGDDASGDPKKGKGKRGNSRSTSIPPAG
ncbi:MAG: polymer-forming cytoskeletal protein [Myxococcales bacterium]|nr:polymer-forming cytoskeletal protein [Myxococcales bacterium]